jgi:hypothetical protein
VLHLSTSPHPQLILIATKAEHHHPTSNFQLPTKEDIIIIIISFSSSFEPPS